MSMKLLNHRQTQWAEYLSHFNFMIVYHPGKAGGKPYALTHRLGDLAQGGDKYLIKQQKAVLKPQNLSKITYICLRMSCPAMVGYPWTKGSSKLCEPMPLPIRFSPCFKQGNNTAGKYLYLNARNVIATYYTNNDYKSLQRTAYDYRYSRATMTPQPLDTLDESKPSTSSNNGISGQPCEKTLNDT
jgi:hypothetical protein